MKLLNESNYNWGRISVGILNYVCESTIIWKYLMVDSVELEGMTQNWMTMIRAKF